MKRILIFSLVYYPRFVGGAEVAIKELTDRLGDDISFDLITLRKQAPAFERIGKVNVYRVGFPWQGSRTASSKTFPLAKILFPFFAYRKAQSLHAQRHYDAVWGMMAAYAGFAALFFKLRNSRVPFLLTLQEGDPIPYIKRRAALVYPLFKRIFTRADTIQAISTYLGNFGRSMGFRGPLEIIPNGVDIKHFSQTLSPEERTRIRTTLGVSPEDILLVTASRLVLKNATDEVIRALIQFPPNIHFIVLGTGRDREKLELLAQHLGVAARVHFIGFVDHAELPNYLKACDIFIRPSRSEGMGNSFIEAMAAGLPVIATQEGGISDFLFDETRDPGEETTGWAVDKDSPEQIVAAVEDILLRREQVERVTRTAQRLVADGYDWKHIALQMRELFNRLFIA